MAKIKETISRRQGGLRRPATKSKPKRRRLNQAGRPTAAELEKRKARVMQVATDLFVTNGYAATSLVDIARGAGVATRTLYQHFGDKEAMFREVIYARDSAGALERPTVTPGDTLLDALLRAGEYAHDVTFREQSIGLMRLMIAESGRFPDFMKQVATSIFARFRKNIEKVFVALEEAKLIPNGDHARSAELFFDFVLGSHPIMTYTNWDADSPTPEDLRERVELFIMGRFGSKVAKGADVRKAKG
ncbi:MAG: TetR/AcrR family transcriptional regulator [Novosphingobium sp.]|nr:TetR/AcrR family transcriptional regulator [Novosphingobium sp.]